jgi:excisionase family DNA binding protein
LYRPLNIRSKPCLLSVAPCGHFLRIFGHKTRAYHIFGKAQEPASEEVKMEAQSEEQNDVIPGWFSYKAASSYTGLSETSLWRCVRAGLLHPARWGRTVRFSRQELDELLESRRSKH